MKNIFGESLTNPFPGPGQKEGWSHGSKLALTSTVGLMVGAAGLYAILNQELIISWLMANSDIAFGILGAFISLAIIAAIAAYCYHNAHKKNAANENVLTYDENCKKVDNPPNEKSQHHSNIAPNIAIGVGFFMGSGVGAASLYSILEPDLAWTLIKLNPQIAVPVILAAILIIGLCIKTVNKTEPASETAERARNEVAYLGISQ